MRNTLLYVFVGMVSILPNLSCAADSYDYPIKNPLIATVFGSPAKLKVSVDPDVPHREKRLDIFLNREVPQIVMATEFKYAVAFQDKPAPLIFVIAGTGSSYRAGKMRVLESSFYNAGFHVVSLSSPTYANFIMNASSTHIPGNGYQDAHDLYHAMRSIQNEHKDEIKVTDYFLTGYSLGGANVGFVASVDAEQQLFGFKKVMMINPPVDLQNSMNNVDQLLVKNIPGPVADDLNTFLSRILAQLSRAYIESESVNFNDEFLYELVEADIEGGNGSRQHELEALIGASFRFASANMVTVADFSAKTGYIVPKNHQFDLGESTTPYFKVAMQIGFGKYMENIYLPYYAERYPQASRASLIKATSLKSLETYLRESSNISVMHNADDIILSPGDIEYLEDIFGTRLTLYPRGGHIGNLDYPENMETLVNYFLE